MLKIHDKTKPTLATLDDKFIASTLDEYIYDMISMEFYDPSYDVVSDDVWKKFGLDGPHCESTQYENCQGANSLGETSQYQYQSPRNDPLDDIVLDIAGIPDLSHIEFRELCKMLYHDCMWAGHCGSKDHCPDEFKSFSKCSKSLGSTPFLPPGHEKTPATKQQPVAAGRSLLLKPVVKPVPVLPSPDSPPISDDEDPKGQTSTLKMLNDAINECDIDEDSDLCEYFGEDGDLVADEPEELPAAPPKPYFPPQNDHSYHKDKNASMRMDNLGIDTPSDSEEEIDVVSVGEKNRIGYGLPTNPSSQYQEHLERTVESAITKKRPPTSGIKTLPPIRKCSSVDSSPAKKRIPESRGVKRSRHHFGRSTSSQPAFKRRAIQPTNGSDSEPELEKRSLHNNMERQRRVDLRNAFEDLRKLVPRLSVMDRAAKVQILQDSRDYCYHLTNVSENMQRKVQELRRQQERLRGRVSQLRRSLAAKR